MTNKEPESLPTLDEAIQLFAKYARGEGDFDELDLKEVIYAHKPDENEKDEMVESIVDDLLLGHRAWANLYLGGKTLVHEKRIINNRKVRAISALNAHYKAKYEEIERLARIDELESLPVGVDDMCTDEWRERLASLQPQSQKGDRS